MGNQEIGTGSRVFLRRMVPSLVFMAGALGMGLVSGPEEILAQAPRDQIHLSMSLGGYVKLGIGFTHWMKEHHAMELTVFPLAYPWEGLHMDVKAGYNWIPSDEIWRAKLGGNFTLMIHQPEGHGDWFTPLLSFTPGIHYNPEDERCFRVDLWLSYYLKEEVFAPTGIEVLYGLRR